MENINDHAGFEQLPLSIQLKQVSDALLTFSPTQTHIEQLKEQLRTLVEVLDNPSISERG